MSTPDTDGEARLEVIREYIRDGVGGSRSLLEVIAFVRRQGWHELEANEEAHHRLATVILTSGFVFRGGRVYLGTPTVGDA